MRGPVLNRIMLLPCVVETQQEPDGSWVAIRPAYVFRQIMAAGATQEDAMDNLRAMIRKYTGDPE